MLTLLHCPPEGDGCMRGETDCCTPGRIGQGKKKPLEELPGVVRYTLSSCILSRSHRTRLS